MIHTSIHTVWRLWLFEPKRDFMFFSWATKADMVHRVSVEEEIEVRNKKV